MGRKVSVSKHFFQMNLIENFNNFSHFLLQEVWGYFPNDEILTGKKKSEFVVSSCIFLELSLLQ